MWKLVAYIFPFIPSWSFFSSEAGRQQGSLRSHVQRDWFLSSNTCGIREKQFCSLGFCCFHIKDWFTSSSCSPRGSCVIGRVQGKNTKPKNSWVTSQSPHLLKPHHSFTHTHTRTVPRLNKQGCIYWKAPSGIQNWEHLLELQCVLSSDTILYGCWRFLQIEARAHYLSCFLNLFFPFWNHTF